MTIEYRDQAMTSIEARRELRRLIDAGQVDADKARTNWLWEVANGEICVRAK